MYILFLVKLKRERWPFWSEHAYIYALNNISLTRRGNVKYKSFHHPSLILPVVIGDTIFKINQQALLLNQCRDIFSSRPK